MPAPQESPAEERTIYVANFGEQATDEILEELFTQTGPVVKVIIRDVKDSTAKYALVEFEDEASVLFAIELMNGVRLFDKEIQVKPRNGTKQEELYRKKRGEIEERQRDNTERGDRRRSYDDRRDYSRDRSPRRDSWDRNSSRNSRNGSSSSNSSTPGGRDSWQSPRHQHSQRQQQNDYLIPPPTPPMIGGVGGQGSWRNQGGGGSHYQQREQQHQFATPQMLPHQHFVNMMQQQIRNSAPPAYNTNPRHHHQNETQPRHQQHQNQNPRQNQHNDRRGGSDRNAANHYNRNSSGGGGRF